jgi:uncharacterized membrane protein YozB (DUF420 family)
MITATIILTAVTLILATVDVIDRRRRSRRRHRAIRRRITRWT